MTEVTEEGLFGALWEARASLVAEVLQHESSLPRALALLHGRERRQEGNDARQPGIDRFPDGTAIYASTHVVGTGTIRPAHCDFDGVSVRYLADLLRREPVDAVVELGSGIGQRLFALYLAGAPRRIPYYGAELYARARTMAERLAWLEPEMDFRGVPFDLGRPDLSFLAGHRRVLLFSNAAIYCVRELPADFFSVLAAAAPAVVGVHFELMGHQSGEGLDPGSPAYAYAERQRLNIDFIPKLLAAARSDVIDLRYFGPHLYSLSSNQMVTAAQWRTPT